MPAADKRVCGERGAENVPLLPLVFELHELAHARPVGGFGLRIVARGPVSQPDLLRAL